MKTLKILGEYLVVAIVGGSVVFILCVSGCGAIW